MVYTDDPEKMAESDGAYGRGVMVYAFPMDYKKENRSVEEKLDHTMVVKK